METERTTNHVHLSASILPLIILCEGFVSIAVEILTIRQLLPVAGGSVIVTSLIIGIFLLFLAVGYRRGGRIEGNLASALRINFLIAAAWLGIGLSYLFIDRFFVLTEKIVGSHIIYQLMLYLIFIIAPLIYILGQTVPITMNMSRKNKRVGTIGGDTLGLSTVGSFLGATITALLFVQYLGVAWTILINVCVLICLVFILSVHIKQFLYYLFLSTILIIIVYALNVIVEQIAFVETNNYANYEIIQAPLAHLKPNEKILISNNSLSSFINAERKGFPYIELLKRIIFNDLQFHNKNILVLGAGGFTFSAEKSNGNHINYVEIDSHLKQAVIPKFLDHYEGKLIIDDARHYIRGTSDKYDAIIIDAYSNLRSIPAFLITYEFLKEVQSKLQKNGFAFINIIARPTLSDPYSKRIDNTIRAAFQSCSAIPLVYSDKITNIIYICQNNAAISDRKVYIDNLNTSTTDAFGW